MIAENRPSLDERYISATNSSDLSLNPNATCDATHLIAAGLAGNRMGSALLHLQAEWHKAGKPRKWTESEILARAEVHPKRQGKPDVKRARTEALLAYATALRKRAHGLNGWIPALVIMGEWADQRGVDPDLLSPALYHFLAPVCPVCDGHGKRRMEDAPVLGKQCYHCNGAGMWPQPQGADRVQDWLKSCLGKAKRDRAQLLHPQKD